MRDRMFRDFDAMDDRHRMMIRDAAGLLIAVADDTGVSLVDVIAEMEAYIMNWTKVGAPGPVDPERRNYAMVPRLAEVKP